MKKMVYSFGDGKADGKAAMRDLLGGKGAGLHEMTRLGVPVPPGFTITTEVCTYYYAHEERYPRGLEKEVSAALAKIEKIMGRRFGDASHALLVSVRSGARESMPGMMDTVLNLGLNDATVQGLIARTRNPRFAYDCYRRFIQMYGDVVLGLKPRDKYERDPFEMVLERIKKSRGVRFDTELGPDDLQEVIGAFKDEIKSRCGKDFPEDPQEQLWGAMGAVFGSWNNERAIAYRDIYRIPHNWGTAVNVQTMVFGNMGETSATGVAFTRDPATGAKGLYGDFLVNAQGEDVVAGTRTPRPISELKRLMPKAFSELDRVARLLEKHYRDMQDIEFTIEEGTLWMLQTRTGKRTGFAAIRIAVDMVEEKIIGKQEALLRVEPEQLNQLLRPIFDPSDKEAAVRGERILAKGLPAGPGAAAGRLVFHAEDAETWNRRGEKVILCRIETSPEDIRGMSVAQGILTARGGRTSHAALVARQMGKVCVVGCEALEIDYPSRQVHIQEKVLGEGDWISVDGTTGEVLEGQLRTYPSEVLQSLLNGKPKGPGSEVYRRYAKLMGWADEARKIKVRTNADLPDQARLSVALGAEGIGLCRTEHMFFEGTRIDAVREMILAEDADGRRRALEKLLPIQKEDFKGIFRAMGERPVTIRTLDPPLHEFLPKTEREIEELARGMGVAASDVANKVEALREFNPMLGHRGCRLGISYPEITEMQARAIFQAACELKLEGKKPFPEVMVPLVGTLMEFRLQKEVVQRGAEQTMAEYGTRVNYLIGTMIELPRACLVADQIALEAEFFSFGTNDLTQTSMGLSRDDSGKFLPAYISLGIFAEDPFVTIDPEGVGELMRLAVQKGRKGRKKLKIGICGEHGGDPRSVEFCHSIGLDYVSCSPYRIPIARLSAAQAALQNNKNKKK